MNDAIVTQIWMAGVVATMFVFAIAAGVGYARARARERVQTQRDVTTNKRP